MSLNFSLLIVLNMFCIHHTIGKRVILKADTCSSLFGRRVDPKDRTTRWVVDESRGDCSICNSDDASPSWLVTKPIPAADSKRIHVSVKMFRSQCAVCRNQDIKVYILHKALAADLSKAVSILKSLPLVANLSNAKDDTEKIHAFHFEPKTRNFFIVLLSAGSCTLIKDIVLSYFVCDKNISKLANLPQTVAPASGLQRVNSTSCSENSDGEAYGLCSSEGTWKIISLCACKKGYGLNIERKCIECQEIWYKDIAGNGRCIPCPRNSDTSGEKKVCLCKTGFYRFQGENHTQPCYGVPSAVERITYFEKTESSVVVIWKSPIRQFNQNVLFDILCNKCSSRIDSEPCTEPCGPFVTFSPSQQNLTYAHVTVQGLKEDTEYQFIIYSKNDNSLRISRTNWKWRDVRIKTKGATSPPTTNTGNNIGVVIGISVTVVLMLAIASILAYCRWKRKRGNADYESGYEEPAQNAQPGRNPPQNKNLPQVPNVEGIYEEPAQNAQPGRNPPQSEYLPPVRNVEGIYEEPAQYAQLDNSKRVTIDGNYQSLNAHYTKLDKSLNEDVEEYTPLHTIDNPENLLEYVTVK